MIHLWRKGSTSPYSRVLSKLLGCTQGNHGLSSDALGYLFNGQQYQHGHGHGLDDQFQNDDGASANIGGGGGEEKKTDDLHDPWLSTTKRSKFYHKTNINNSNTSAYASKCTEIHQEEEEEEKVLVVTIVAVAVVVTVLKHFGVVC